MDDKRYSLLWGPLDKDGRPEIARVVLFEGRADAEIFARLAQHIAPAERITRAERTLSRLATLLPHRVRQEEIGDALEVIVALKKAGCPAFTLWLVVCSTIFWAVLNGLRETVTALLTGWKSPRR